MNEELLTYGKVNSHISPELDLWGWPIAFYLFAGGMAAGLLFFASFFYLRGKHEQYATTIKWAPMLVPPLLIVGLGLLFYDLHVKMNVMRLYMTLNLESPMSWGAWTLLVVTPLSIFWVLPYLIEKYPVAPGKYRNIQKVANQLESYRKPMAWSLIVLSILLGIYTGILLSAFNARPLWNTSVLGILFLVSGLSTAVVAIMWMSKKSAEVRKLRMIDIGLIAIEIFLIIHMIMGLLAGPEAAQSAVFILLTGSYAVYFWGFVVVLGLIIPLLLEILESRGVKIPVYIAPVLVLFGGLCFRIVMIYAGQLSSI
jgi:formate-dependent nitrite reductase membrane component NrfD